jgi:hypothetical protein
LPATDTPLPPTETPSPPTATATVISPTVTPVPPTATLTPTKKPIQKRVQFQTAEEMIGILKRQRTWDLPDVFIRFNPEGTYQYTMRSIHLLDKDPSTWGEWWFEDGNLHLRDIGRKEHDTWEACGSDIIAIYTVTLLPAGNIQIKSLTDKCSCTYTETCRREMITGFWEWAVSP